ncbi:TPA: hypothetical protein EYP44_03435 [Candidatus Bathyarchaeota archaeon]|nr:hypothetical protein [Candidatus Bathyarchaeota archaeon]
MAAMLTIILPAKALEVLRRRSRFEDKSLEELVSVILLKSLRMGDPRDRAELHLGLCRKYLREGGNLLRKEDYTQASEKYWGAASQMVKAVAAKRGVDIKSHGELHGFVAKLRKEIDDAEIGRLWRSAIALHQNFYENWLPPEMVKEASDDVERFVERLEEIART